MNSCAVVTIGVFDGMHRGHQDVLDRAREAARGSRCRMIVLSFATHPQVVLSQGGAPPLLTTTDEKVRLFFAYGAEEVRLLDFNARLREKDPGRFLRENVFPHYRLSRLVVGYDFAMGKERKGTIPFLAGLGKALEFEVERVGPIRDSHGPVSSTRIRQALSQGDVGVTRALLGRPYSVSGRVVPGEGLGRELGFPTANLATHAQKLIPARGVYAAWARLPEQESRFPAVLNIGVRPTVSGTRETVEVHLMDFSGDLRGSHVEVDFIGRLRDERKFKDTKALSDQLAKDVRAGRALLEGDSANSL